MTYGYPNASFVGRPVPVRSAAGAGPGLREASRADAPEILEHYRALDRSDRWTRFCEALGDAAIARHIAGIWSRDALVLVAEDGPPSDAGRPERAVAELVVDGAEAEIGLSVEAGFRRRRLGTRLVQAALGLLAPRGVLRIRAWTVPGNHACIGLAYASGARIEAGTDAVEITFEVADLRRAHFRRCAAQAFLLAG